MTYTPVCTVIVAVYNGVEFLSQCLDSLMSQTLDGVEVIVADDGSTDQTPQMLTQYAEQYANIHIITLDTNHGQAYARNQALTVAHGRYVCYLDADDWYAPDALRQAVDVFEHYPLTDCVLFNVVMWHSAHSQHPLPMQPFEMMGGREAFEKSLTWQVHGVYMARRELYERYPYDDTCRAYSDDNTTRLHYYISRQVRCCSGSYYYRQHASSVTHKADIRHFDYLRANESMRRQLVQLGVDSALIRLYDNQRWLVLVDCYRFYYINRKHLSPEDRSKALSEMHRIWMLIDTSVLTVGNKYKLGYMPLRPVWPLFCIQEEIYFTLKRWLRRL